MLDELLRALAHEARRQILEACRERTQPAGALVTLVGLAPASVSEHLKVLRKTGLNLHTGSSGMSHRKAA